MNASNPTQIKTKEEEEAERKELLEKIKDASNGPEHAKRRIEALDKTVSNLKSNRRKCAAKMREDEEAMYWIDKEVEKINKLYLPLKDRLAKRIEARDTVKQNLELAQDTMRKIVEQTKGTSRSGVLANARMQKKAASAKLRETRGFGCDPSTTYKQKGPNVRYPTKYTF